MIWNIDLQSCYASYLQMKRNSGRSIWNTTDNSDAILNKKESGTRLTSYVIKRNRERGDWQRLRRRYKLYLSIFNVHGKSLSHKSKPLGSHFSCIMIRLTVFSKAPKVQKDDIWRRLTSVSSRITSSFCRFMSQTTGDPEIKLLLAELLRLPNMSTHRSRDRTNSFLSNVYWERS